MNNQDRNRLVTSARISGRSSATYVGLLIGSIASSVSLAQVTGNATSASTTALEEIIVTAERRPEDIQKTAASVSVRLGDDLLTQGKYQLSQILEDVPGITGGAKENAGNADVPGSDNVAAGLVIRGIPSNAPAGGNITTTASAAAYYVDDVYNGIGGSYDIDRVEFLRGPQGTLYGRSATSGVVVAHTRDPNLSDFNGYGAGEFATANLRNISAAVNLPIVNDKLAVRVSANRFEQDGYDAPKGGRRTSWDGRVKILFKPTGDLSILVGGAMNNSEFFTGEYNFVVKGPSNVPPKTAAPIRGVDTKNRQLWTNINWDLGSIGLQYIGSYRTYVAEGGVYLTTLGQDVSTPYDHFHTHELRVHSVNNSTLQWQAGVVSYANGLRDHNKIYSLTTGALSNEAFTDKKTDALGAFGEATYHLTEALRLTGGLRYDDTEVRVSETFTPASTVNPIGGGTPRTIDGNGEGRRTFYKVTYKARIEYDLTPSSMIYVSTSTGTSPGDVALANNGSGATATPTVTAFASETNKAYELGSKNRFLDNRLQVNVALFHQEYGGFQTAVNTNPAVTPATYTSVTTPITSYGGEFELTARLWQGGTLGFNAAYTHARYHDIDPSGAQYFGVPNVRHVVPFQTSLSLDQEFPLWSNASLTLHGDARYLSAYDAGRISVAQANAGLRPYQRNDAAVFGDVSATLSFADRYSLTAYCRNVGDKRQLTGTFTIISATPVYTPGPLPFASGEKYTAPRTFGLVATAKF